MAALPAGYSIVATPQAKTTIPEGYQVVQPPPDPRDNGGGKMDAAVRGAADSLSFGLADEFAAGMDALTQPLLGRGSDAGSFGDRYAANVAAERGIDTADAQDRTGYRVAGQVGGALTGAAGLARQGLSMGLRAAEGGAGLAGTVGALAADGGIQGFAHGFGSGEDSAASRLSSAGIEGGVGLVAGGALPIAGRAISTVAGPVVAPIMARLRPDRYAEDAVTATLRRAGANPQQVADDLRLAQQDGQGVFTVADALGNAGQRALSTVARNPHDERQAVVDALQARQAGQGRRVITALQDASGTTETAAQTQARLTAERAAQANADYSALRQQIGDAPMWGDELQDLTSRPSIRQAIGEAQSIGAERGYPVHNPFQKAEDGTLSLPEGTAPNFTFWDTVKRGVDRQIAKDPTNRDLVATKNRLVEVLDQMAPDYAAARAPFAATSREIDAIDTGRQAAMRGRTEDTIPAFQAMTPGQQQAYRSGYFDPLIAQTEGAAFGANKARPLMSAATEAEFPAIAAPGAAPQLGSRLAREARMFETNQAALGGSKTADNLADAGDFQQFDPGVMSALMRGRIGEALIKGAGRLVNEGKGMPPAVVERMSRILMQTDPVAAEEALTGSVRSSSAADRRKALAALLLGAGTRGATAGAYGP